MKPRLSKFFLAVAILAIASLACNAVIPGGDTNPIATAEPGGNDGGGDANPPSGRPLLSDDFKGRDSNWGTGTDPDSSVEYVDDALQFIVFAANYFVYSTPNDVDYQNVHIEVTASNDSIDQNAAFGIMCNQQVTDSAYYYAYITSAGDYGIAKAAVAKDNEDLVTGSSDLIPQDAASYRIGMDCGNGILTLYVNGQKIDSIADASYSDGEVALFAWSDEVAAGTSVTYDDFVITALP